MKIKRKLAGLLAVVAAVTMLGACQVNETSEASGSNSSTSSKEEYYIPVEDIEWSVDTGIVDGKRAVCFEYTNNSEYTITDVEFRFTPKEEDSEEEQAIRDEIKSTYELDDEEIGNIYIKASVEAITNPSDTATEKCKINSWYSIENIEYYNLMEPDILEVSYIASDNKIYTFYYDYKTEKYTKASSGDGIDAVEWSDSALASLISQPEAPVISVSIDKTDCYIFDAYGVSYESFKAYVESCKNAGFTVDASGYDDFYTATNAEGYDLDLYYYDDDNKINVSLDAPTE